MSAQKTLPFAALACPKGSISSSEIPQRVTLQNVARLDIMTASDMTAPDMPIQQAVFQGQLIKRESLRILQQPTTRK